LEYAVFVEPENSVIAEKLKWAKAKRERGEYTIPSTMQQEHDTNPFLRAIKMQPDVILHCGLCDDPVSAMKFCREEKSAGAHKMKKCC